MRDSSIEQACERLVLDFTYFSDHRENEALADLFTPDGIMTRPSGDRLVGRDAILKEYESRPAGRIARHFCTNIRIVVESDNRARGLTYALVYSALAHEPPLQHFGPRVEPRQLIGEFEDEFVRTDDGWKIASRSARFVMHTA
jgi:hypothetical protein